MLAFRVIALQSVPQVGRALHETRLAPTKSVGKHMGVCTEQECMVHPFLATATN